LRNYRSDGGIFIAIKVALIGNPNVGKSVIFNNLTGSRQHVGNWPGKTVEKKEGICVHKGIKMEIVDLPGTYSLTARSIDELIARNYILEENPDVVVDIIDASNIERNLYLTMLLMELEVQIVIALNMIDVAKNKGYKIDLEKISTLLGVLVIPTIAIKKIGMEDLKDAILEASEREKKRHRHTVLSYGKDIEELILKVTNIIEKDPRLTKLYSPRWLAVRLLDGDEDALEKIKDSPNKEEMLKVIG
jgi:ferrous iron transport protein B